MANVTLFIPDNLKKRMDEHEEIRWSHSIRSIIEQRLDDFEEAEKLARKSRLTMEDVAQLSAKVNEDTRKHVKALLHENRSGR